MRPEVFNTPGTGFHTQHFWGFPYCPVGRVAALRSCSFNTVVLRPTVAALYKVLFESLDTGLVKWPTQPDSLQRVCSGFEAKFKLSGCAGAIDGSLICMKKPKRSATGGDADAYFGYKGFVSHLLFAVVDSNKMFTYVNAGAPGCVGDSGLYKRTQLYRNIEGGALRQIDIPLRYGGNVEHIQPYLVGDAAFQLSTHMLKNFRPGQAPAGSAKSTLNMRLTNCRRQSEIAFGELKGRWGVCKRNTHWNDMSFLRGATCVCCVLCIIS
jgi:hypothetical protein